MNMFFKPGLSRIAIALTLLSVLLVGCGSCFGPCAPATGPGAQGQTPGSPQAGPGVQTIISPGQSPTGPHYGQSPTSPLSSPDYEEEPELEITFETVEKIKPGMTYEDVLDMLGQPGLLVAGTNDSNSIYRWSLSGVSFTGRFENNVLTRKNVISMSDELNYKPDEDMIGLDRELFERLKPGMTYEEALEVVGMDAQPLTDDKQKVVIYKWTDEHGSSITARFEDKILVRKSGSILASGKGDAVEEQAEDSDVERGPVDRVADEPEDDERTVDVGAQEQTSASPPTETVAQAPAPAPSRVRVTGTSRREREAASDGTARQRRSYQPQAKFPEYRRKLRGGSYEIRVHNTTDSKARAAIISSEGGTELTIPAQGRASATVNQGDYRFYFIYDDDPYTLHQGQQIPVAEMLTDFSVYLFADSSDVDFLERGNEPSSGRSRR